MSAKRIGDYVLGLASVCLGGTLALLAFSDPSPEAIQYVSAAILVGVGISSLVRAARGE